MIFLTVFIISFLSANYLTTGAVTNTWIGIAIFAGIIAAIVRRVVVGRFDVRLS